MVHGGGSGRSTPTALVLTRQNLPQLEMTGKDALRGAYVLLDPGKKPEIILMASGSEVHLVLEAGKQLMERGKRSSSFSMYRPGNPVRGAKDGRPYRESGASV